MDRELTISPILVNHQPKPTPNSWVKIFIYEPAEEEALATRGRMYAVLSVAAKVPVDFTPIMQLILEELHSQYFQKTEGGILQALESTLDGIHKKLLLMGQQDKRLSAGFSFNLLTAVSWGTVLYFGQLGSSRAALLRKNQLYDIDEGEQKTTSLYMSSGVLHPEDRMILATDEFFKQLGRAKIQSKLAAEPEALAKAFEQDLSQSPAKAMQSAIVLLVDIKQVPSYQDEALHIVDPQTSTNPVAAPLASLSRTTQSAKSWAQRALHWHIAGRIPGLPLAIAAIALVILASSIYWSTQHRPVASTNQDLQPLIAQATDQINQAQAVVAVNPDRADDLIEQAQRDINQGLAAQPQNAQLQQLHHQALQLQDTIIQAQALSSVASLGQFSGTVTQPRLVFTSQHLYTLDSAGALHQVSLQGQDKTVATNKKLSNALLATSDTSLAAAAGTQVYPLSLTGNLGAAINLPASVKPAAIAGFRKNSYVLDKVGQIWRIASDATNTTNPPTTYFRQPIDGTSLLDLAVDGSVYILRQHGQLELYLNGDKQNLSLERASLAEAATAIFTSEDSSKLYLLSDSAILVWSKEGKYQGQYFLPNKPRLQAAGIDFANHTLYILSEGKIFKAALP